MGKYGRCRAKGGVSKYVGKCVGCGKEETDSGGSVVTSGSWWHDKCAGVKVADYNGAALWTCPNCLKVRQARHASDRGADLEDGEYRHGGVQEEDEHGYAHHPHPNSHSHT
jgi:hypothetical protein